MPESILKKYWGYPAFREKQLDVIQSVLDGKDTFASLPTGGGKSLCYQVPALMMDGVCIVISPLIALMRDQVDQLKQRNISATYLYSGLTKRETQIELENIRNNRYKLVYVSPERLQSKDFQNNLKYTKVSFIAVDEAHCISQWGHDFRPEFRQIASIREVLENVVILALTASATPQVKDDIIAQLKLTNPTIVSKSFHRSNLSYRVEYSENKRGRMVEELQTNSDTGVIYVRTRRMTVQLAKHLVMHGVNADYYHGGLSTEERNKKQDKWMRGDTRVIVTTNAFGMGIDKGNVRFVFHYDVPESMEAYYQEAGRAGRDGRPSVCTLFYDEEDILQAKKFLASRFPSLSEINQVYQSVCNYFELAFYSGLDSRFNFDLADFCKKFELPAFSVYSSLQLLEKLGYLNLSESMFRPSKLKIEVSSTELYDFQLRNPSLDSLIKIILRSYTGIYDYYATINETVIAKRLNQPVAQVQNQLKHLTEHGVIAYSPRSEKPFITFLRERVDKVVDLEGVLKMDQERMTSRLDAMLQYLEVETCRAQEICNYFGEQLKETCGICDICEIQSKHKLKNSEYSEIENYLLELLKGETPQDYGSIRVATPYSEEDTLLVLRWLIDDKRVFQNKSGYLQTKF